jgi:hypothetical protein
VLGTWVTYRIIDYWKLATPLEDLGTFNGIGKCFNVLKVEDKYILSWDWKF